MSADSEKNPPHSTAEMVSLAISLVMLTIVVGVVAALWVSTTDRPAAFRFERGTVRFEEGFFYLPVEVTNLGDRSAQEVKVEGTLTVKGTEETADTTIDFLPGGSSENVVLIFSEDPSGAAVRVSSYQEPP